MEKRPTRRVYIEILTCAPIFYHLEDSRSHGNEQEDERARGRVPALPLWVPALAQQPIRLSLVDHAPPPLRIKENHAIKVSLIRRPTFIWKGYISRLPGPWKTCLFYRIKAWVSIIHPSGEDPSSLSIFSCSSSSSSSS